MRGRTLSLGLVVPLAFGWRASVAVAQPTCVLMYDFEENSGPQGWLADSSGFGAPLPMMKFASAGATGVAYSPDAPVSGDGHVFGGSSLRVGQTWSMGYAADATNRKHELQNLTVEAWVKLPPSATGAGTVVAHVPTAAACIGRGWSLQAGGPSGAAFVIGVGDYSFGVAVGVLSDAPLTPDRWHHIAGSYDGTTLRVFVDGIERRSRNFPAIIDYSTASRPSGPCSGQGGPSPTTTYLGAYHNANPSGPTETAHLWSGLFEGTLLDRVRVLNVAAAGSSGEGSPAFELDYFLCHSDCAADIDDGSGTGTCNGSVDINDLLFFLSSFEAGSLDVDLDNGTSTGTPDNAVDINDLLFFLARFEAGC